MLELKLKIEGKAKTFKQKEVSARAMRQMMSFYTKIEKAEKAETALNELEMLDEMIVLVADMFLDPAVNFDTILDGLTADELFPVLQSVLEQVSDLGKQKTTAQTVATA
ncbi:phage tail assembly chaperone G [Enterococcus sp. AZ102]|uniref:phage tail assembly chaperone G n=1 Tax=Enterococcus sp. AZ102 TaxID=2774865 RepID=UPI003F1E7B47